MFEYVSNTESIDDFFDRDGACSNGRNRRMVSVDQRIENKSRSGMIKVVIDILNRRGRRPFDIDEVVIGYGDSQRTASSGKDRGRQGG